MIQYGLFNDESADYTEGESVESGFYSYAEAERAIRERYSEDDELEVHEVEQEEETEEDDPDDDQNPA